MIELDVFVIIDKGKKKEISYGYRYGVYNKFVNPSNLFNSSDPIHFLPC
jgi:hypothetical protein